MLNSHFTVFIRECLKGFFDKVLTKMSEQFNKQNIISVLFFPYVSMHQVTFGYILPIYYLNDLRVTLFNKAHGYGQGKPTDPKV